MEDLRSKPNQNEKINAGNLINCLKLRKRLRERKVGKKRIKEEIDINLCQGRNLFSKTQMQKKNISVSKECLFHLYSYIYVGPRNYSNYSPHLPEYQVSSYHSTIHPHWSPSLLEWSKPSNTETTWYLTELNSTW